MLVRQILSSMRGAISIKRRFKNYLNLRRSCQVAAGIWHNLSFSGAFIDFPHFIMRKAIIATEQTQKQKHTKEKKTVESLTHSLSSNHLLSNTASGFSDISPWDHLNIGTYDRSWHSGGVWHGQRARAEPKACKVKQGRRKRI